MFYIEGKKKTFWRNFKSFFKLSNWCCWRFNWFRWKPISL